MNEATMTDMTAPLHAARSHTLWPLALVVAGLLAWVAWPLAIVPAGHRGAMTTMGKPSEEVYGEGVHPHMPFVQNMHLMDMRLAKNEGQGEAASRELQAVQAVATRFTAEELITRRTEVRDPIAAVLREKMSRHGLVLDAFAIVNFAFSPSFESAIEAKVGAEQQKLKADRDLQRIQVEAEQRIASARAEADGLRLQRQEVTPLLLDLRRMENDRLAIAKWNGQLPTTSVGAGAQPFLALAAAR